MTLSSGTFLGPYQIVAPLGAGGMGEVYRARDTRLDRTVAIKILPAHLSSDPARKQRFEREARTISSLNHPHICVLHDVGHQQGIDYLVMECVEGETLAQRLEKGPLPLEPSLRCAIDVAGALAEAHRAGITHRDLKPGNVMLTKSGPKLLDFGLAKIQTAGGFDSQSAAPTQAAPLTGAGVILGTLQYMSPEQIEGKEADARTDIFAFGVMLYEMITGTRAFEGKSQASLVAAILEHEPLPMSALQTMTPAALEHLVRRCLDKDPDHRWQSALDLVHELGWILESGSGAAVATVASPSRKPWIWMAATALCLIAALAIAVVHFNEVPLSQPVLRYAIPLPKEGQSEGLFFNFHISPDGRSLAASGVTSQTFGVFVRELDSENFDPPLRETNTADFFWSPDSRYIAFFDGQKLKKVKVSGGPAEEICLLPGTVTAFLWASGSWSRDDVILFSPPTTSALLRVPARGGEPRPATKAASGERHVYPAFLPDGQNFLYTVKGGASPGIYVASLDNPAGRRLLADQSSALFAPGASDKGDGFLLFVREEKLMAQRFDPKTLESRGEAFKVVDRPLLADTGAAAVSVSNNGYLTYLGGRNRQTDSRLAWFDRSGKELATEGPTGRESPVSLSPDEKTAVVWRPQGDHDVGDLFLVDLSRANSTRSTFDNTIVRNGNVVWSPDGNRIAYSAAVTGSVLSGAVDLYVKDARVSGPGKPIVQNVNPKYVSDWSRDGLLVWTEIDPKTDSDVWYLRVDGSAEDKAKPVPLLITKYQESFGQISPDGHWIAYLSDESGGKEVYVKSFPQLAGQCKVSETQGITQTQQPRWNRNGKELFYLTRAVGSYSLMAAQVTEALPGATPSFKTGVPKELFSVRINGYHPGTGTFFYSVSNDGQRFLVDYIDSAYEPVLNVIVNWEQAVLRAK